MTGAPRLLSVIERAEAKALLKQLPLAVDNERFVEFVTGFPRRYLETTARADIVKHYLLLESLRQKTVISSLAREGDLWKLSLVTRDRSFLLSRIAGTLNCFGMNIQTAEAFANANSLVLDTFAFKDLEAYFAQVDHRRHFQVFLEEVVEGKADFSPLIGKRLEEVRTALGENLTVEFDNACHPTSTRMHLRCRDRFGLLYLVSRFLSEEGYNIEMAYIQTSGDDVRDEFYLTRGDQKLSAESCDQLGLRLLALRDGLPRTGVAPAERRPA